MIRGGKSTACHTNVLSQDTAWKLWIMSWPFGQSLWTIHQTIFQICLHDPTAAVENGFILSLDSSLVPLWGWILQTVVDSLGTSLQQVKICTHENWEVEIQTLFRKFSKMWVGNEKRCFRSDLHPRLHLCGQHWSLLCRGQGETILECLPNVLTHSNLKYSNLTHLFLLEIFITMA